MTMHSEAAPQSVHSSCCTNGTARLPVENPSFLSAGKPSTMFLLVAMGGESLWGDGGFRAGANRKAGQWALAGTGVASLGQVLLEAGQQRDEERLGLDLDLDLGVHAVVVVIGVVLGLERARREPGAGGGPRRGLRR